VHYAVWLTSQCSITNLQLQLTVTKIKNKIKEAKAKLWQLFGNPKRRMKWLEDLAGSQALEKVMDPGKCLWHLQHTEEQCCIAWQIQYTNQRHQQAGGLSQVTTVMAAGIKIQHTNQNNT